MIRNAAIVTLLVATMLAVVSCSENDNIGLYDEDPPDVSIERPWDNTDRFGMVEVVVDADDNVGVSQVDLYANGVHIGSDETAPYRFDWNMDDYDDESENTLYAVAHDVNGNSAESDVVTISKRETAFPSANLATPVDGATYAQGDPISFSGSGDDAEDGAISAGNITWISNLQGEFKQGDAFDYRGLVIGEHDISMIVYDSNAMADTTTISVTITENDLPYAVVDAGTYTIASPTYNPSVVELRQAPFYIMKHEVSVRDAAEALDHFFTPEDDEHPVIEFMEDKNVLINQIYAFDRNADPFGRDRGILSVPRLLFSFSDAPVDEDEYDDWYDDELIVDPNFDNLMYRDYPVLFLNYFEACMICNALSEMQGLDLAYRLIDSRGNDAAGHVGDDNNVNLDRLQVVEIVRGANGWRLPTEAEWEVAARAGFVGKKFPWGNQGPGSLANSMSDPQPPSPIPMVDGHGPVPVDSYNPNRYGLYNMVGNAAELMSDMLTANPPSGVDPLGFRTEGISTAQFLAKGGTWYDYGPGLAIGIRSYFLSLNISESKRAINSGIGLRLARTPRAGE